MLPSSPQAGVYILLAFSFLYISQHPATAAQASAKSQWSVKWNETSEVHNKNKHNPCFIRAPGAQKSAGRSHKNMTLLLVVIKIIFLSLLILFHVWFHFQSCCRSRRQLIWRYCVAFRRTLCLFKGDGLVLCQAHTQVWFSLWGLQLNFWKI